MTNQKTLKLKCTVPLWLRLYIKALRLFADTFGFNVDIVKVSAMLGKHIKTEVVR